MPARTGCRARGRRTRLVGLRRSLSRALRTTACGCSCCSRRSRRCAPRSARPRSVCSRDPNAHDVSSSAQLGRITTHDRDAARGAKRQRAAFAQALVPASRRARRAQDPLRRALSRAGAEVKSWGTLPSAITVGVRRSRLREIAGRADVQAITPAPKPNPLLDIASQVDGAPSWYAAGFRGGTGASDTVPAVVGLLGEAPDVRPSRVQRREP